MYIVFHGELIKHNLRFVLLVSIFPKPADQPPPPPKTQKRGGKALLLLPDATSSLFSSLKKQCFFSSDLFYSHILDLKNISLYKEQVILSFPFPGS